MITLKSHGFKYSRPEANFVFDVSYFPNPWREKEIRTAPKIKRNKLSIDFMRKQDGVNDFILHVAGLIKFMDTYFPEENLIFAICCSSGEYRSPAIVELIKETLSTI